MLPDAMTLAAYQADAFRVLVLLAVAATGLFVFGSRLSIAFERARRLGHAREETLQFAPASYLAERALRQHVFGYTDISDTDGHLKF
ncbi:hypothetical protein [Xanthomonas sp. SHU 166]|uniref:hypothetical protein n=1 Tax=Xanthomonas sp. SHU 166 TaxID=1591170 RepID=UPI0005C291AF|nr:hypothetical protein [Xanthomonas sp. SHU 166]